MDGRNNMKLLIPLRKRNIQPGSRSTEGSDSADQLSVITVCLYAMLRIRERRIHARITERQEYYIFAGIKTGFKCFCSFGMIFF